MPARKLAFVLVLAAAGFGASRAHAQEREEDEEVVVRGDSAGGFVSRMKLERAPREITDVASLLEPMPGVHVRRQGSDDAFATLSIRGTSSTQVAVYLAGVPLSGGADPTLDLATLPLWPGADARVYRSFAPAALGRGSLGGTLVLAPPSPRAEEATDVSIAAGSFGSRRMRVGNVTRAPGGVRIASALSASRSDDDFSYLDPIATRARGEEVFRVRDNAGHAQASGLVSVAMPVRLSDASTGALTTTTLAQARRQELPGTVSVPTRDQALQSTRLVQALELTVPSGRGAFGVRAWGRRDGLSVRAGPDAVRKTFGPRSTDDAIVAAGTSLGWRGRPTDATTLEARVDGSGERFAPGTWLGATAPPSARRTNGGLALDASVRTRGRTTLRASGRGDAWLDSADDGTESATARPTGHLGLEQGVGPVVLAAHGGALARPASFIERYGNRGTFLGEPNLRPESAVTVDAGARTDLRRGALRLHAELSGFGTWADDLIVFVAQGAQGLLRATNVGRARIVGAEALVQVSAWGFALRVAHTALATTNLGEIGRPPLPGRPAHDLVSDLAWQRGPLRIRYGVDVMTGMRADVRGDVPVPARVLHGAGVRLAIPQVRGLTLSLEARNLFDLRAGDVPNALGGTDRYPIGDLFDYPLPGRRALAVLRWVGP